MKMKMIYGYTLTTYLPNGEESRVTSGFTTPEKRDAAVAALPKVDHKVIDTFDVTAGLYLTMLQGESK